MGLKQLPTPIKSKSKKISVHKHIVYSGLSGAIATTCIYPIDIVKTKLQDQKGSDFIVSS